MGVTPTKYIEYHSSSINGIPLDGVHWWTAFVSSKAKYCDYGGLYKGHLRNINLGFKGMYKNVSVIVPIPNVRSDALSQYVNITFMIDNSKSPRSRYTYKVNVDKALRNYSYVSVSTSNNITSKGDVKCHVDIRVYSTTPAPDLVPVCTYSFVISYTEIISINNTTGVYDVNSIKAMFSTIYLTT
jgi:hypothetical protein